MKKYIEYLDTVKSILTKIVDSQADSIEAAIDLLFSAFSNGNSIFIFGATHAGILAEEMYARAGGLMIINPIFNPTLMLDTRPLTVTSDMERLEGFGTILLNHTPIKKDDVLIISSVSGRNSVSIDMALEARKKGIKIITITSLDYSNNVKSRHSSGKFLSELSDIVIDNCGEFGDACIATADEEIKVGPTSTVAGAAIVNMLAVGFAQKCEEAGIEAPIFESANKDTDDQRMIRIISKYLKQIHYLDF